MFNVRLAGGHLYGKQPGPDPEHSITGGIESRRVDVSGVSGGEYERGFPPLILGVRGLSPGKKLGNRGAVEAFLSLF